ncbi:MAG: hypothetical protein NTW28_15520, partial [Candidatus Solibacter sp.]|nr:hypothetical protein [Candidatus Solibacter sp.]
MRRLAPIAALFLLSLPAMAARQIALVTEGELGPPARHGLAKLQEALRAKGFEIAVNGAQADYVILAGTGASATLREWHAPVPAGRESLTVWRGRYRNKPAIALRGGDARGLMYAALDTAVRIAWSSNDPFQYVRNTTEKPYLAERGISMYTMQRAYFESRLYDEAHWKRYFDMLAADRINSFVVIFGYENGGFMAPLYPYFFDVKAFPAVEMVGMTKPQQARNTAAFQAMIRLAHERGIAVTAGIWDHIYRGGVQGGGIPGASQNAGQRVPGLVWGVTAENLAVYNKAALKRFLEVFPEIDAIQFRMHDESGLKPEEIQPFWHDVFSSIRQTHPDLRLDLRAKGLPDAVIDDALNLGLKAKISTKYWMEQMGLPFHPTHINSEDQRNRRHGYADLLRYPQRYRVHWQLWSGGTTRLLLWGDPDYVRRFATTARLYDGDSFEINEMLATKMLGEPHDEQPLEILNPAYRFYDYEFERYWQFYRLWGRLTYNPETAADVWEHEFTARYGTPAAAPVGKALQLASQVLPRIVAASYRYSNFPTTRGWAEMSRQGSLPEYAGEQGSDIQQFLNVRDAARSIVQGSDTAMRRPEETSRWFAHTAFGILTQVALAEKAGGSGKEFRTTIADLKILAGLARYHSRRLLAGVCYNLYKETGDLTSFDEAIAYEKTALDAWGQLVAAAGDVYSENLAFGAHAVGFSRHWKEEQQILARNFEQLQAERQKAVAKPGANHFALRMTETAPPSARLLPVAPGLEIAARVTAPAGVKWVRLR